MRFGFFISLVLHGGILAAGLLVLPVPKLALPEALQIVPIDLVTVAETTNVRASIPDPKPKPKPEPEIAPPLDTPSPATPELAKPEPVKEKPVQQEAVPEPKPVKKKPIAKKPAPKKKPKPKPKPLEFDLARLESKLAAQDVPNPPENETYEAARAAIGAGDAMTASEIDLLRAQMYRCWRAPLDAPNPAKLRVTVRARLNPDGTLQSVPEIVNQGQINRSNDRFWRTAADNARRAVLKCQPYKLPAEKYALWRETVMHFTAEDVLGN